jgi:hypothetical protein
LTERFLVSWRRRQRRGQETRGRCDISVCDYRRLRRRHTRMLHCISKLYELVLREAVWLKWRGLVDSATHQTSILQWQACSSHRWHGCRLGEMHGDFDTALATYKLYSRVVALTRLVPRLIGGTFLRDETTRIARCISSSSSIISW